MKKDVFVSEVRRLIGKDQEGSRIRESVAMSFLLGTIGDRLGVPMETMTRAQILERNGGKEVTTYVDPREWRTCGPEWGVFTRPAEASDDTALMLCSMRAIRKGSGVYHVTHAAMELVNTVLHGNVQGWGGTVRSQVALIERYFTTCGREGRSPHVPGVFGSGMGHGNGAVLRAAPLIWAHYLWVGAIPTSSEHYFKQWSDREKLNKALMAPSRNPPPRYRSHAERLGTQMVADARITHSDNGYGVAGVQGFSAVQRDLCMLSLLAKSPETWPFACRLAPVKDRHGVRRLRVPQRAVFLDGPRVTSSIKEEVQKAHFLRTCSIEELTAEIGLDGDAAESVPLAMWIAIRHADDPRAALIEAINAGGDTDSVAFLVGQLVGFHSTLDQLPEEWIEGEVGKELLALVRDELVPFLDCYPRTVQENE